MPNEFLSMISESTVPVFPVAESNFCMKIFWGSYQLTEHSAASHPHSSQRTSKTLRWGRMVEGKLSSQRPAASLLLLSQRARFKAFVNRLRVTTHSLLHWAQRGQWKVPCKISVSPSQTWLSSLLNKGLSSSSPQNDGVSTGALSWGWGWAGNIQKIENKNDLCKSSSGKPAFLVACIYNIKGGNYK